MADKGKLKIFLSYAPGVGKTYQLLDEAHRRQRRGQKVVVAAVDPKGRSATLGMLEGFETLAPLSSGGIDIDAIVASEPEVAVVDDLAHPNPKSAAQACRWEEVETLLQRGVNVLTTLDVSSLESLADQVKDITGVAVEDRVPDRLLHEAYEVEIVDLPVRALTNRLDRGDIFPGREPSEKEKEFFRDGNLVALRELALREAAGRVDEDLIEYRREKRIEKPWAAQDRVLICISPTRSSLRLIRRGWRMGQRMRGEVIAIHVEDGSNPGEHAAKILEEDFALCERLGIDTHRTKGDLADTLIKFAKERNVTAVIMGHPERTRLQGLLKTSILTELARELRTVDIIVVSTEAAHS
ncbi:hypothetical protein BH11ARM2_BH11ARM2_30470 [soil metagenome]